MQELVVADTTYQSKPLEDAASHNTLSWPLPQSLALAHVTRDLANSPAYQTGSPQGLHLCVTVESNVRALVEKCAQDYYKEDGKNRSETPLILNSG